jgi:hypothetical protein
MSRENVFERVDRMINVAVKHFKTGKNAKELPEEVANVFERWEMAYRISKKYSSRGKEYILSVYSVYIKERHGIIDERTIREDLYAAPLLFVKIEPTNREFKRMLAIERLEKAIHRAELNGKYAEQARLEAVLFKYLDPNDDPIVETNMDDIVKNFNIMPAFNPKLLGVKDVSEEYVMKFKSKMLQKKRRLLDEVEEAEEYIIPSEDLEDERTT